MANGFQVNGLTTQIVGYLRTITIPRADHGLTFEFIRGITTTHRHGAIAIHGIRLIAVIPRMRLIRDTPHIADTPHIDHIRLIDRVLQVLNVGIILDDKFTS